MSALGKRSSRSISLRKAAARLSLPEIHRVCRPLDVLTSPADKERNLLFVQYSIPQTHFHMELFTAHSLISYGAVGRQLEKQCVVGDPS